MKAQAAYDELVRLACQRALLGSCTALLAWDEETYMPRGGALRPISWPIWPGWNINRRPTRALATCWPM